MTWADVRAVQRCALQRPRWNDPAGLTMPDLDWFMASSEQVQADFPGRIGWMVELGESVGFIRTIFRYLGIHA